MCKKEWQRATWKYITAQRAVSPKIHLAQISINLVTFILFFMSCLSEKTIRAPKIRTSDKGMFSNRFWIFTLVLRGKKEWKVCSYFCGFVSLRQIFFFTFGNHKLAELCVLRMLTSQRDWEKSLLLKENVKKSYLESRGQVVLEEPEFDWSFGVLQNRQHHNPERGWRDWGRRTLRTKN